MNVVIKATDVIEISLIFFLVRMIEISSISIQLTRHSHVSPPIHHNQTVSLKTPKFNSHLHEIFTDVHLQYGHTLLGTVKFTAVHPSFSLYQPVVEPLNDLSTSISNPRSRNLYKSNTWKATIINIPPIKQEA